MKAMSNLEGILTQWIFTRIPVYIRKIKKPAEGFSSAGKNIFYSDCAAWIFSMALLGLSFLGENLPPTQATTAPTAMVR